LNTIYIDRFQKTTDYLNILLFSGFADRTQKNTHKKSAVSFLSVLKHRKNPPHFMPVLLMPLWAFYCSASALLFI